jgi:WD repeat-containing protein 23
MSSSASPPGQRSGSHTPRLSDTIYHVAREWPDDEDDAEDDQDMDYEPESERTDDIEYIDEDDEDEDDEDEDEDFATAHDLFRETIPKQLPHYAASDRLPHRGS